MMTALFKKLSSKARSTRGESITEVLVAIVVAGLAILMLAMAITVSANINLKSRDSMNGYYAANNDIIEGGTDPRRETDVVTLRVVSGSGALAATYPVTYTSGSQVNGEPVVSYEYAGA